MNSLKLFSFCLLLVAINARPYEEHVHAPAPYKFSYGVSDHHTGDHHQHHEESDGHIVRGSYSLKEPDGTIRIVDYYAGPHTGFHAIVRRIGHPDPKQHYQVFGGEHHQEIGGEEQQGGVEQGGEELGGEEQGGGEIEEYGGQGGIEGEGQSGYGEQEEYQQQGAQEEGDAQSYTGAQQWGYEQ